MSRFTNQWNQVVLNSQMLQNYNKNKAELKFKYLRTNKQMFCFPSIMEHGFIKLAMRPSTQPDPLSCFLQWPSRFGEGQKCNPHFESFRESTIRITSPPTTPLYHCFSNCCDGPNWRAKWRPSLRAVKDVCKASCHWLIRTVNQIPAIRQSLEWTLHRWITTKPRVYWFYKILMIEK